MVTLDTLRREKKAEIIRLAEASGCSNVRVFGSVATARTGRIAMWISWWTWNPGARSSISRDFWRSEGSAGTEVDLVESRSIHPYIRDRVLAEAVGL